MIIFSSFLAFTFGIFIGFSVYKFFMKKNEEEVKKDQIEVLNSIFNQLLRSMLNGKVKYKNRVNQASYLLSELDEHGVVEVVYMMDKKEIGIFKEGKCIYVSDLVDKQIIRNISEFIESVFKREINEVVNVFGLTLSKTEFEKTFKIKFEDFEKFKDNLFNSNSNLDMNIVDLNIDEEEKVFDVDEILDKISIYGISSLTNEERTFLDNYSNEKRD